MVILVILAISPGSAAPSNDQDPHLSADSAHALYARSAFAHGYRHGYEEGFFWADKDLQAGRDRREFASTPGFRKADNAYHREYGDAFSYHSGFREGFHSGYDDSYANRPFRAVQLGRTLSEGLDPNSAPDLNFDSGFFAGYLAGHKHDQPNAYGNVNLQYISTYCVAHVQGMAADKALRFCDGYSRGFTLGLSDSRVAPRAQTASAP